MSSAFPTQRRPRVAFVTLGCAKNEVDSEHMRARVLSQGFEVSRDPSDADAIVVNTCSFIQSATEESIEAILEVAGLPEVAAGNAALIVAGCMPARYGSDLEGELAEASAFVPCSKEDDIAQVVADALHVQLPLEDVRSSEWLGAVPEGVGHFEDGAVSAYVKISDGCDRFCSFCTIPFIRGRYHSFPYEEVLEEVRARVSEGVREIVLIAQDTGRWGQDLGEEDSLASLLDRLAAAFPSTWFRVMYIQPEGVTDDLLHVMAAHANVCRYLDIPLQHVVPRILASMRRRGCREDFERLVERVRAVMPDVTLRTTLIAGFPGETDDDFEELCDFVEEGFFDYVGVFPYSREEGTRAYSLPDQVEDDEKADRAQRLRDLADDVSAPIIHERVGRRMDVLVEGMEDDGQVFGRAMCQAPEVDGVTYVHSGKPGEVLSVLITDTLLYEMEGE